MNADDCGVSVLEVSYEIFNLVGKGVRCAHFNRIGQVENNGIFLCRAESLHNLVADVNSIVHLRTAEAFWRIFKAEVCVAVVFVDELFNQMCALNGNFRNAVHIGLENNLSLECRG